MTSFLQLLDVYFFSRLREEHIEFADKFVSRFPGHKSHAMELRVFSQRWVTKSFIKVREKLDVAKCLQQLGYIKPTLETVNLCAWRTYRFDTTFVPTIPAGGQDGAQESHGETATEELKNFVAKFAQTDQQHPNALANDDISDGEAECRKKARKEKTKKPVGRPKNHPPVDTNTRKITQFWKRPPQPHIADADAM